MTNNFNDTLDRIKLSLESGERQFGYGEDQGDPEKADRILEYATTLFTRTATMNAVFQTEVMLVIADSLERIANALDDDNEISGAQFAAAQARWSRPQ